MRALYTALLLCGVPFLLARLHWRGRRNPAYRHRIGERFGYYTGQAPARETVWVHAVSVGEVQSAIPLVRRLQAAHPGLQILFTTTTPTGSSQVQASLAEVVEHCYLPYDLPSCVSRFLRRFRPRLAVILETEIWPNLFAACGRQSIPLVIVNGRLSQRSANGYRRIGSLVRKTLAHVSAIAAQTESDAQRFLSIGASPEKIFRLGNIKFDLEMVDDFADKGRRDRQQLFPDRPVLIAASTHEDEERQILGVFGSLLEQFPALLLVLAPRHPERFAAVASLCRNFGYTAVSRSENRACEIKDRIFLLDSIGELRRFYAASDVAFVGGSLVPVGGHNVLEPAAVAVPVLFGPHVNNFREICSSLAASGGALECEDSAVLAMQIGALFADPVRRTEMGARARDFVASNRGALDRAVALLEPYLPAAPEALDSESPSASSSKATGRPIK